MISHCQFYYYKIRRLFYCLLKSFVKIAVVLMSTKPGFMLVSVLPIQTAELITSKLVSRLFLKDSRNCLTDLLNITVLKFVWNLPASIGSLFLMFLRKQMSLLSFLTLNIPNHKKEIRPIVRILNGSAIYSCVIW